MKSEARLQATELNAENLTSGLREKRAGVWQTSRFAGLAASDSKGQEWNLSNCSRNLVNRVYEDAVLKRDGSCRMLGTQGDIAGLVKAAGGACKTLAGNQLKAFWQKSGRIRHRTCI